MRITRLYERNIVGIEELDIKPGTLTAVTGKNGAGKSSVAAGLVALIDGGHDATLIRAGQKSGEIVIELDNGWKFRKPVSKSKRGVEGVDENGVPIPEPASVLKGLFNLKTVNVNRFVQLPPKEKAEYLLRLCDITLTQEQLTSIGVALGDLNLSEMVLDENGLTALERVHDAAYEMRQAIGRKRDECKGTVAKLSESVPEELSEDHREKISEMRGELVALEASKQTIDSSLREKLEKDQRKAENVANAARGVHIERRLALEPHIEMRHKQFEANTASLAKDYELAVAKYQADFDKAIAKFQADFEEKRNKAYAIMKEEERRFLTERDAEIRMIEDEMKTCDELRDKESDKLRVVYMEQRAKAKDEHAAAVAEVNGKISDLVPRIKEAETQWEAWIKSAATREVRDAARKQAEQEDAKYKALTAKLKSLEALKLKMVEELPIAGLEPDSEHYLRYNGIPLERVNTAQQFMLALNAAAISDAEIGLAFVDGLECLDEENFKHFEKIALQLGESKNMQFLYTAVRQGELKIETRS